MSKTAARKKPAPPRSNPRIAMAIKSSEEEAVTTIPLGQLLAWSGNVRKTGAKDNLAQIKASMLAHGVLQSVVVRPVKGGKYEVVAGRQRLSGLEALRKDAAVDAFGRMVDARYPVPCRIRTLTDEQALEVSLAENEVREQLHPADQAEAFHDLALNGASLASIAASFGVTETVVKKRLALANLSPKIIAAFRKGLLDIEQAQAYTVSRDHRRQEALFRDFPDVGGEAIRDTLTDGKVAFDDRRVLYVTLEAYEAAGGQITPDLFSKEDRKAVYIEDASLLTELFAEKLRKDAEGIQAGGWGWVTVDADNEISDWAIGQQYEEAPHKKRPMTPAEKKDHAAYKKELAAIEKKYEITDKENARRDTLRDLIAAIEAGLIEWTEKVKQGAGCILRVDGDGRLDVRYGLVTKKEAKKQERAAKKEKAQATDETSPAPAQEPEEESALSNRVLEDLSVHRTAALVVGCAQNEAVGLAAVAYTLVLQAFYNQGKAQSCLNLAAKDTFRAFARKRGAHKALDILDAMHEQWHQKLPRHDVDLWDWIVTQPHAVVSELIRYAGARTLSDIGHGRLGAHAGQVWRALGLDMAQYFTPSEEILLDKLNRRQLTAILEDIDGIFTELAKPELVNRRPIDWPKTKKDDLIAYVASRVRAAAEAGKPWLPQALRLPEVKTVEGDHEK